MTLADIVRVGELHGLQGTLEDNGSLYNPEGSTVKVSKVTYTRGTEIKSGAFLLYDNTPKNHAIAEDDFAHYLKAIRVVANHSDELDFLIMSNRHHSFHVGADIKENRRRLRDDEDGYFGWTANRLFTGTKVAQAISDLKEKGIVTVSILGSDNYGASTEVALMSRYTVADSRARLALTEAQFGIVPFIGLYLLAKKTSIDNARVIALTTKLFNSYELYNMGIVSKIVGIEGEYKNPHPKADGLEAAETEDNRTHSVLFPETLDFVMDAIEDSEKVVPRIWTPQIINPEELFSRTLERSRYETYRSFGGQPLTAALEKLGMESPLSPFSVEAIQSYLDRLERLPGWKLSTKRDKLMTQNLLLDLELYASHRNHILKGLDAALARPREVPKDWI